MLSNLIVVQYCYQFLSEQISMGLLLYSHLPAAIFALLFSIFVLWKAKNRPSVMLFATCLMFALWAIFDLGAWFAFLGSYSSMFTWSLLDIFAVSMFFFAYYFLYTFSTRKDLPLWQKIAGFCLLLPTAYVTVRGLHLPIYDLNSCAAWEDRAYTSYAHFSEMIILFTVVTFTVRHYRKTKDVVERNRSLLASTGVLIFLGFFFSAIYLVSLLAATDVSTYVYNYLIYGLFGMPVFLVFLGYLVVHYQAFDLKMFNAQALIIGMIALISSQFFFTTSFTITVLITITLTLACIGGFLLIRSVRKQIKQREEIEKLAKRLDKANKKLKVLDQLKSEFVSIASHQLRSPLTSIRGYSSMLLEGSYGKIPAKAVEAIERIGESSRFMALSVEDYLNVSRIQSGGMKYNCTDFNIRDIAEAVADEMRPEGIKKGLVITFRTDVKSKCIVNGDIGKTKQIIQNLVDNSMKYTPKGTIKILVHDNKKKKRVYVQITDTGIGMTPETIENVFGKFERAHNANEVNVTGTGLGLFVADKMAADMGGDVYAVSEGEGKGSTFTLELPLQL